MISILLAAYKSEELLKKVFIPGLQNCSIDCEVIVYDNGGNNLSENGLDKEFSFLSKNKSNIDWIPIGDGKNIGLNAALNECSKVAKYDYFYLPHTDMYLMPNWDVSLIAEAKKHAPHTYLFCSRSIEGTLGHTPFHIIKNYGQEAVEFNEIKLLEDFKHYKDNSIVTAYRMPFFMHKKLWERLEQFNLKFFNKKEGVDSNYFSYVTDSDLFINVYYIGIRKFWMINNSLIYHLQGKSNNQQKVDKDSNKPYEMYYSKWNKFGFNTSLHIDRLEQSLIPWNLKIK